MDDFGQRGYTKTTEQAITAFVWAKMREGFSNGKGQQVGNIQSKKSKEGVYRTEKNVWLGWDTTCGFNEKIGKEVGSHVAAELRCPALEFGRQQEARQVY